MKPIERQTVKDQSDHSAGAYASQRRSRGNTRRKRSPTSNRKMGSISDRRPRPSELNHTQGLDLSRRGKGRDGEAEPVIIGGMVLDINATPSLTAKPRTTTPGQVCYAQGGVARNVAECMSKLGTRPYMISALGLDMAGNLLLEYWRSAGLSIDGIQRNQEIETAVVCNIFDAEGELAAAVASVESIERYLTPTWIKKFKSNISSAPIMLVDANLSPPAVEASCKLAAELDTPVWFEPVSVVKSKRVASAVNNITFTSPNEDELISMANALSCEDTFSPIQIGSSTTRSSPESLFRLLRPAICVLLDKGIKVVIVTFGPEGVLLCSRGRHSLKKIGINRNKLNGFSRKLCETVSLMCPQDRFFSASRTAESLGLFAVHFPALSASVVRLTGAGDCLVGGILASVCAGLDVMQSVAVGIAAAKAAVEVETNVPSEYNLTSIADDARSVYFGAKVVFSQSML